MEQEKKTQHAISPTRAENYPEWYQQVVQQADMAQNSPVRGCMVIKPWGYGIWEHIQRILDQKFKETGHQNAYFPLFIPISYLQKEADHVAGFAKECAVVTHSRLQQMEDGSLQPVDPLEEPLIVRPTSETIIGELYAQWVQSYRDLPILLNQWANVVRWEMRTRLFLRTTEFLWQEGHTAHATREEATEEAQQMHQVYTRFCHDYLALPVVPGEKTESERFPGAERTLTIEGLMQDGKALQAGTSHFLGQTFAKASNIKFLDRDGSTQFAWTTSWGMTTRLVGAMVMTHGDDDGMVVPPRVAPFQVVLLPVIHKGTDAQAVWNYCQALKQQLEKTFFDGVPVRVTVDKRDLAGGDKNWQWIKKGIPVRIPIGPRDMAAGTLSVYRRDCSHKDAQAYPEATLAEELPKLLEAIQQNLYQKALHFRQAHTALIETPEAFRAFFSGETKGGLEHGGFAQVFCHLTAELEQSLKTELKVSPRCIPLEAEQKRGVCVFSGMPDAPCILFARAY